jgi:SAM-dependent methyltransferase
MKRKKNRVIPSNLEIEHNLNEGLEKNSEADNYLDWISDLCKPYLGLKILEVGAGKGDFTERFSKSAHVTATELSISSIDSLKERFDSCANITITRFDIFSSPANLFDSTVLINVLEHIENDVEALKSLRSQIRPGGFILVYVPAHWLLYSKFDNSIGHYRRYSKRELIYIAKQAGFEVQKCHYVNMVGSLGWFVICRIFGKRASGGSSVGFMNQFIIPIMRKVEKLIHPPFGVSVFLVGRKTSDGNSHQGNY